MVFVLFFPWKTLQTLLGKKRSQSLVASVALTINIQKRPPGGWGICGYPSHVPMASTVNQWQNTRPRSPEDASKSFLPWCCKKHLPVSSSKIYHNSCLSEILAPFLYTNWSCDLHTRLSNMLRAHMHATQLPASLPSYL